MLLVLAVEIPNWAIGAFGTVFLLVLALAGWALKSMIGRIGEDVKEVGKKVDKLNGSISEKIDDLDEKVQGIDKRLVAVETKIGEKGPPLHTPPFGVPVTD